MRRPDGTVYFDHNASAPLDPVVRQALLEGFAHDLHANTFGAHAAGRQSWELVEDARARVAALLPGQGSSGVVFTSGASESNALALAGAPDAKPWACAPVEHPSVLAWCETRLEVGSSGLVDAASLGELDARAFRGVSLQLANHETGVVQPLTQLIPLARARGLLVHVDASQAPGRLPLEALAAADLVTVSSHKIGGPQGVGALIVRGGGRAVEALLARSRGGPQERGARAGTHPALLLHAFGVACQRVPARLWEASRVRALRDALEAGLQAMGARILGTGAHRLPNTSCAVLPGMPAADLVMALDLEGLAVSAGAACTSGSSRPSAGLLALGARDGAVRFSLGLESTDADVAFALGALARVRARLGRSDAP